MKPTDFRSYNKDHAYASNEGNKAGDMGYRADYDMNENLSDAGGAIEGQPENGAQRKKDAKHKKKHKHAKRNILLTFLAVIAALVAAALITAAVASTMWLRDIPQMDDLSQYSRSGITTIYASDGQTKLATITYENRIEVSADEISQYAKDAIVAVEDERFYEHGALDPIGIARAVVSTAKGSTQGASTITQQLARNTVLRDEMSDRTLERKVREAYVALALESKYSKDDILAAYLNIVNFSNSNYGIEAASRDYFGIPASDLSLAQAAMLVGIPNSPSQYNPRENMDAVKQRQKHVLSRMLANEMITQEEYDVALAEEIVLSDPIERNDTVSSIAPYFVDYVKTLLTDDMQYNVQDGIGGCSIYTTLDVKAQDAATTAIEDVLKTSDLDASLTAVDPENGYILAMVGGRNYEENNFNLSTQMNRQPGSTFKPFTLIAAMNQGISPLTRYDSTSPAKITDEWTVNNSEGHGSGMMTLTAATTSSVNTVYARLAHEIGAQAIVDTAHEMGIKSNLLADETITLGTSGVNTLEMASAYATIADGGVFHEPIAITKIEDDRGTAIYDVSEAQLEGDRVMSEDIAYKATEVMETVITSGTGRGAKLANGQEAAGKTGTSEHGRDLWFVGFTPQVSCAIWTGYREEKETSLYGGTTSTPIWKKFMDAYLKGTEKKSFTDPDDDKLMFTTGNASDMITTIAEAAAEAEIAEEEAAELAGETDPDSSGSSNGSSASSSSVSTSTSSSSSAGSTSTSSSSAKREGQSASKR